MARLKYERELPVKRLADALVYAVSYINNRPGGRDELVQDDDVAALEVLADILGRATDAEKDALSAAANLALDAEMSRGTRSDTEAAQVYGNWMEAMFGEGWVGNDRADETT